MGALAPVVGIGPYNTTRTQARTYTLPPRICWQGGFFMCVKTEQIGLLLIGAGVGLLLSFALCGWFLRVLIAAILIVLGLLILK